MIYNVNLVRLELFCVFDLKGSKTDITSRLAKLRIVPPENPNTAAMSVNAMLCWVGPNHWILRASQSKADVLISEFETNHVKKENISIVDVSDMLQFFSISGVGATDVITVCCALDTHSTAFPRNSVTFTEIFGTKALLLRDSEGFQIAVDRSYADFIDDNLHRILGIPLEVDHTGRPAQTSNLEVTTSSPSVE